MFNLVEKRRWYFLLSAFIIIPGILVMLYSIFQIGSPFRLSIDFEGGSIFDVTFEDDTVTEDAIRDVFATVGDDNVVIQQLGQTEQRWILRDLAIEDVDSTANAVTVINDIFEAGQLDGTLAARFDNVQERYVLTFENQVVSEDQIRDTFDEVITDETTLEEQTTSRWSIRGSVTQEETIREIEAGLNELAPIDRSTLRQEAVSPTVGREVTRMALFAVLAAAVVITMFIVIAFRQVPNAFRYGVCAIAAMIHDVLVVLGVMSLLGLLLGWEVDALFLTAVLTVVGFSVQDSIVVFDRIRENIPRRLGEPYETIVNRSLWETIHRSLATQLNAFFIMIAILLFGGETVRQFIFILFIGLLSGSYSSLFTAVPLLVAWEKGELPWARPEDELAYEPA